jgi:hypothetical protein
MAAPTVTARSTPSGFKLGDGYQTLLAFASKPSIQLWEKAVKPPGIDGGDGIDTTTMHNQVWRTKDTKHLKTLSESTMTVSYDPDSYNDILTLINKNDSITAHFPDGSALAFYGVLQKFEFGDLKEGEFPEATVSIYPTNYDPTGKVEAAPVFQAASGT